MIGMRGGLKGASETMNSRPSRQRCLMGKLRLGFGQDLYGQENSSLNQSTSPIISIGYRQEDSDKSCLGKQWPETIIGVNDLN